jgi:hypothetical protein
MDDFLPDDYLMPSDLAKPTNTDQFFTPKNGENQIRILTSMKDEKHFALGYEIWERYHDGLGSTGKPKRFQIFFGDRPEVPPGAKEIVQQNHERYKRHSGGRPMDELELSWNNSPKYFWALCVWSYEENEVKVWTPTQSSIITKIKNLATLKRKVTKNGKEELVPVWGSPTTYDLTIVKTKQGDRTEYEVHANPHSDMPEGALEQLAEVDINMNTLFEGGYPMRNPPDPEAEPSSSAPPDDDIPFEPEPSKAEPPKLKVVKKRTPAKPNQDQQLAQYLADNFKEKCKDFTDRPDDAGCSEEELDSLYADIDDLAKSVDPQTLSQLVESANYVLAIYDMEPIGRREGQ